MFASDDARPAGCALTPYVLLRLPDGSLTTDTGDGVVLLSRWLRSSTRRHATSGFCVRHPGTPASLQSIQFKTFHCSPECFVAGWKEAHRAWVAAGGREPRQTADGAPGSGEEHRSTSHASTSFLSNANAGEAWTEVSSSRSYTPSVEDVGHALRYEVAPSPPGGLQAAVFTALQLGARVVAAPQAPPRRFVPLAHHGSRAGRFTVLTYNVLADLYASSELYGSYCPSWALSWAYRRNNLLKEVLSYGADILCLQEVQSDHYEDFFLPELAKAGYASVYKRKTEQMYTGSAYAIDGCATFYRREAFALIKKYEVEFNKAAGSLADSVGPPGARDKAMSRLMKNNGAFE